MKKKPELLKRTGKSSITLRNFLNNLKENDLHYENKQITQCVFLGVLRLKPVPSIFSKNNVPSVSAPVENNKPKRIKNNNSNKEQNKNVSRKNNINKVIGGKVRKKNPEKVKAAVKKVPDKKSTFKIKLHTNKKTSKLKKNVNVPPKDGREASTVSPESSQAVAGDPVPSIGLSPLTSPTKFNPVQNLFDKLKQKIDSTPSEPGPSTVLKETNKTIDDPGPSGEHSKVCKINAKRQINPSVNVNRKSKKTTQRKPVNHERLSMPLKPTSPITISDSDSTGKDSGKKDDVILLEENNFLNNQEVVEEVNTERTAMEDIIFVNEDPKPVKHKERTSPRNKINSTQDKEPTTDNFEKHGVIVINDEPKSTKAKHPSPPKSSESTRRIVETRQKDKSNDIIVISDEPKTKEIARLTTNKAHKDTIEIDNNCKAQAGSKNDVIVVDEIRECRVSPRMKNVETLQGKPKEVQSSNTILQEQEAAVDEVIVIAEETNRIPKVNKTHTAHDKMENCSEESPRDKSKTQELNVTIGNYQNVEKPKQRKPKLKSPLIPPMFLNAPMLLRSELAPKKTTPEVLREKPKRKERIKLLRSNMGHAKNLKNSPVKLNEKNSCTVESENSNISKPRNKYSSLLNPELSNKRKSENYMSLLNSPQTSSTSEEVIFVPDNTKKSNEKCSSRMLKPGRPAKSSEKTKQTDVQVVDLVTEVENLTSDSLRRSDLVDITTPEPSHSTVQESEIRNDIIILNDEPVAEQIHTEKKSTSRLLRSELAQQKSPEISQKESKENKERVTKSRQKLSRSIPELSEEVIVIKEEIKLTEKISPRLLRSDWAKQKIPENSITNNTEAHIKDKKEILQKELPRKAVTEMSLREDNLDNIISLVEISDPSENLGNTPLMLDKHSGIQCIEKSPGEVDKDIMIVKEEPKSKKVSPRTLRSNTAEPIKVEMPEPNKAEEVVLISDDKFPPQKEKPSSRLLRSEIAQQKTRTKSPQKNKQIDLDEIIVVSEKRLRKPKERTISGRLLRSELALQRSRELLQVKTEVEEVVVLIHDEPKPKRNVSPNGENLQQNNKKINIQEEVIVLAEEPKPNKMPSPMSLRSDTDQKHTPEKTSSKTKSPISDDTQEGTSTEKRKLLNSEQNVYSEESKSSVEVKVEKQRVLRSEITEISPHAVLKDHLVHSEVAKEQVPKQTPSSRSHKSITPQHSPENIPIEESKSPSGIHIEKQKLPRSEITSKRSPRTEDLTGIIVVEEKHEIEQLTSPSRLLRSQQSPRNLLEESAGLVERQMLLISEISKKTSPITSVEVVEQMENISSPSLHRSIVSRGFLEQTDSQIKTKVKRLPKSEITPTKIHSDVSRHVASCDVGQDIRTKGELYTPRSLRSDIALMGSSESQSPASQTTVKSPPQEQFDEIKIVDDTSIENKSSPRLLRSEMSLQKSPTILSNQQSESTEAAANISISDIATKKSLLELPGKNAAEMKVKKRRSRKTKSLPIESNGKLKTPMLLRSELAQLKNPNADTLNQVQGLTIRKRRGRKPKVTPPPNIEVPVQPISSDIQAGKSKSSKRKSLIDDLRRKNSPKQKAVAMQNLKSSPEVISEPKTMSEVLPANQNVKNKNSTETVANILPSSLDIKAKIDDISTEAILKCNKSQSAPKVVNLRKKVKENPPEDKFEGQDNLENALVNIISNSIEFETIIDEISTETELKCNNAQSAPKVVKPRKKVKESPPEGDFKAHDDPENAVANVISSSIEFETKVGENSTETILKCNKTQNVPKVIKPRKKAKENHPEDKFKDQDDPENAVANISNSIEFETKVDEISPETILKCNMTQSPSKVVKPRKKVKENPPEGKVKGQDDLENAVANIISNSIEFKTMVDEISTETELKCNEAQSALKVVKPRKKVKESPPEDKFKAHDDPENAVANVISSSIEFETKVGENSTEKILKCNKTQSVPKVAKPRKKAKENHPEDKFKNQNDPENAVANIPNSIVFEMKVDEISTETILKCNKTQSPPKVVKPRKKVKQNPSEDKFKGKDNPENVANIISSSIEFETEVDEIPTKTISKYSKTPSAPKVVKSTKKVKQNPSENKFKVQDDLENAVANIIRSIEIETKVGENSVNTILKCNKAQNALKVVKPRKKVKQNPSEHKFTDQDDPENAVANIIPSSIEIETKADVNSTETISKCNSKTQGTPKVVNRKKVKEHPHEDKFKGQDDSKNAVANIIPKSIEIETKVDVNSAETILKCNNKIQSTPKVVKRRKKVKENPPKDKFKAQDDSENAAANIVPSSIEIETKVDVNSADTILKCNSKIQGTPKVVKRRKKAGENSTETILKCNTTQGIPKIVKPTKKTRENPPEDKFKGQDNPENAVADIIPSSIEFKNKVDENSMENILKCNSKTQGIPKVVKRRKKAKENPPEDLTDKTKAQDDLRSEKRATEVQDTLKSIISKIDIERTTNETPRENVTEHLVISDSKAPDAPKTVTNRKKVKENSTKNPLKRKSDSQDSPESIKPKLSKNVNTSTQLKCAEIQASEKTSPGQNKKTLSAKRKYIRKIKGVELGTSLETPVPTENKPEITTPEKTLKQIDTTVFDFDETEPEVVPLRLTSPRRNRKITPENSKESNSSKSNVDATPKPKKQRLTVNKTNTDDPKTKAQAKAKLLAMFGDKSPQIDNLESPDKPKGKSTKTKCASKIKTDNEQSVASSLTKAETTRKKKKNSVPNKTNTSPAKTATSPMKQTTITDMFSKVLVKKEKETLTEAVFEPGPKETPPEEQLKQTTDGNTMTDMAPPKVEKAVSLTKKEEEENGIYVDDSDDESRAEWMPEEYAEYKFKYCAKKMMGLYSKQAVYKCKICLLILPTYYKMAQHKKKYHHSTPNPYNCLQCVETFSNISDLTAHLRIHKGVKAIHSRTTMQLLAEALAEANKHRSLGMCFHTEVHILFFLKSQ